ncbi:putative karyogamy protein [Erysiphe necator]|uniref:Putative karyogamy protein n=1 Tax=Uncinula necator TaxID=52586 RepID=A0A0B1P1L5_UNCNE|nr:putative karyogamy protein [Erysiphe necator]
MHNELNVSPIFKQPDLIDSQRSSALQLYNISEKSADQGQRRIARRPSPGVAARFQALRLGKELIKSDTRSHNEKVGRISENKIKSLNNRHSANSDFSSSPKLQSQVDSSLHVKKRIPDGISTEITVFHPISLEKTKQKDISVAPKALTSMFDSEKSFTESQINKLTTRSVSYVASDSSDTMNTQTGKFESIGPNSSISSKEALPDSNKSDNRVPEDPPGFNPYGLQRSGSIYTISRASFTSQLAQLTSLQLPDAESLSSKISAITTAKIASKALVRAAEQIRSWIIQASKVITGLIDEDDVEWAAAGGREGLSEVDKAITRFEKLIEVYVSAIELLQSRKDVSDIPLEEHNNIISQVDVILAEWSKIKNTLKYVKNSVEIAMEWEELWDTVLGDIGMEINILRKLVFEMEEKRHKSTMRDDEDKIELAELGTIIEEKIHHKADVKPYRSNLSINSPLTQKFPEQLEVPFDDTKLLALFARMQPLRASLDFFPMRLSAFLSRVGTKFPSACKELESRFMEFEMNWKILERDAESLRKELGEDRWVLVFKLAGQQAQKMYGSVERSFTKLQEVVDNDTCIENSVSLCKRYEKKKEFYGPAIEQVLSIIDKGVKNRLTVNGEILRLHWDIKNKWETLKDQMNQLDKTLAKLQVENMNKNPRDFTSKLNNTDHITSGYLHGTPGSSPASSIVITNQKNSLDPATPGKSLTKNTNKLSQVSGKRISSLPVSIARYRRSLSSSFSTIGSSFGSHSSPKQGIMTPTACNISKSSQLSSSDGKPRWNNSTRVQEGSIGHVYKPTSFKTPSPQSNSKQFVKNSNRLSAESKTLSQPPRAQKDEFLTTPDIILSRTSNSRLSFRDRLSERVFTAGNSSQGFAKSSPNQLRSQISLSTLHVGSKCRAQPSRNEMIDNTPTKASRSVTSLGKNPRMSLLPLPKRGKVSAATFSSPRISSVGNTSTRSIEKKPFRV